MMFKILELLIYFELYSSKFHLLICVSGKYYYLNPAKTPLAHLSFKYKLAGDTTYLW